MSPSRTWKLHLNLDIFNGLYIGLRTPQDQSDFLWGLSLGMNGEDAEDGASRPFTKGFEFGSTMRQEADGYRESRRQIGLKGGAPSHKEPQGKPHGRRKVTMRLPHGEDQVNAIHNPQSIILNPLIQDPESTPLPPCGGSARDEEVQKILQEWNTMAKRVGIHQSRGVGPVLKILKQKSKDPVWVEMFMGCLPFIEGSPFYHGKSDGGWKASLDWLLKPGKVEELTGREPQKPKTGVSDHRQTTDEAYIQQLKEMGMA